MYVNYKSKIKQGNFLGNIIDPTKLESSGADSLVWEGPITMLNPKALVIDTYQV